MEGGLKYVSSGSDVVWGVNSKNEIQYRAGITHTNPIGTSWIQVPGSLKQVEAHGYKSGIWGVNAQDQVFARPV